MKKMLIGLLVLSNLAFSQEEKKDITTIDANIGSRIDHREEASRIQDSFSVRININPFATTNNDFLKSIQIGSLIQNTPAYGLKYHTLYDFNSNQFGLNSENLYLKQIYLKMNLDKRTNLSVGSLPTVDKIGGHTTFGNNTWVDGIRIGQNYSNGAVNYTMGSVNDLENPNTFTRQKSFNYFEIHVTKELFDQVMVELSLGKLDFETFFRTASEFEKSLFWSKIFKFTFEFLISHEETFKQNVAFNIETNLGQYISKLKRFNMSVGYSYGNPNIGLRGQVNDDLYNIGHNVNFTLSGQLDKSGKYSAFTSFDTYQRRVQVGVARKFQGKIQK